MKSKFSDILKKIYTTPNHPASFTSAAKLKHVLLARYGINKPLQEIQDWLNDKRCYSLHRRALHTFKRNPTVVANLDDQWQGDLFFLTLGGRYNMGLICIDIASRFVWVELIKNKSGPEVTNAMQAILKRAEPRKPFKLQTDNGTEFFNKHFQSLMDKYNIKHFSNRSDTTKAAVVERVIRTIKEKIYRALDDNPDLKDNWGSIIQPLVDSYNNTFHVAIQKPPAEVTNSNVGDVLHTLYGQYWLKDRKWKEPKIRENDYVRISTARQPMQKGFKGKWNEEAFKVYQVKYCLPNNLYKLQDTKGEKLLGSFYEHELQKIAYDLEKPFRVQAFLKKRVRKGIKEVLIRWAGYSDDFNSWEKESDVVDYEQ